MGSVEGAAKARARMLALGLIGGPGLLQMLRATGPGECPFCGDRLPCPRTKPRLHCGAPECLTAYNRTYARDRRAGRLRPGLLAALRRGGRPEGAGSRGV